MRITGFALGIAAALAISAGPTLASPTSAPIRADNPIDVQAYCEYNYNTNADLYDRADAFSWRCSGDVDVSMDLACEQQYGENWASAYEDRYDAYSWYCYWQGD